MSEPFSPPPPPAGPAGGVSENRTLWFVLSYLWLVALLPYLIEKNDSEVQWHAKNGLVWTIPEVLLHIILGVGAIVPFVGCVTVLISMGLLLGSLILRILAIQKALAGQRMEIAFLTPYISQLP